MIFKNNVVKKTHNIGCEIFWQWLSLDRAWRLIQRLGSYSLVHKLTKRVEHIRYEHKLARIKLYDTRVRQQLGALYHDFECFNAIVLVPSAHQGIIELVNALDVVLLRQIRHLEHVLVVELIELF